MLGLFLEDIDEGLGVDLGSYQFSRENILAFAQKYDPQPFHLSEQALPGHSAGFRPVAGIRRRAG
jgi:acyl dehydratase